MDLTDEIKDSYVIETQALTKHYGGVHALNAADFFLLRGEHVAVVGDNGAGKSTLVRNITGVEQPTSGEIYFYGEHVHFNSPMDARHAGIEAVYQNLALADHLDVPANIFLGREDVIDSLTIPLINVRIPLGPLSWMRSEAMSQRSKELLEETGVNIPDPSQKLFGMSGGQRQCVAIARAAGWGSKLIIMDEPTAALGIQETARVENIIRGLKEQGVPLIIISHNLRQVFNLVDRIWVFRHGHIVGNRLVSETNPNEIVAMITGVDEGVHENASYI